MDASYHGYNPVQSILRKIKKSSKVIQNLKPLKSVLNIFELQCQRFISPGIYFSS